MINKTKHSSGFTLVGTIVIMVMLLAIGGSVATMVMRSNETVVAYKNTNTAESIAWVGFEQTTQSLQADGNWTDDSGDVNGAALGGTYKVTKAEAATHSIRVISKGTLGDETFELNKQLVRDATMARDVIATVENAYLSNGNKKLKQIELTNTGTDSAVLDQVIVSWDDNNGEEIKKVIIDGDRWKHNGTGSPDGEQPSGTVLTFGSAYSLLSGAQNIPFELEWDSDMTAKSISLILLFSDGSAISVEFAPVVGDESTLLNVDSSSAEVGGGGNKELKEIDLSNLSQSEDVTIAKMTVSWVYNKPVKTMTEIKFDNSTVWGTDTAVSGEQVSVSGGTISAGDSKILKIKYDSDMRYHQFTILFEMTDGTTKNAVIDLRFSQADFLTIDTSSASIDSTKLDNVTLLNTHSDGDVWIKAINLDMTPHSGQVVETIFIGDTQVFDELDTPNTVDTLLEINPTQVLTSAMAHPIDFSSTLSEGTYSLTYTMSDDTTSSSVFEVSETVPQAGAMECDVLYVNLNSNRKDLQDIYLSNPSGEDITITTISTSWDPVGNAKLKRHKFGGVTKYNNNSGDSSGSNIALDTNYTLLAGASNIIHDIFFTKEIPNTDFTLTYGFSDGSSKTIYVYKNPGNTVQWIAGDNFEDEVTLDGRRVRSSLRRCVKQN